ncbi:hypothetical protein ACSSS7_006311 [Eimeria intestinalis]
MAELYAGLEELPTYYDKRTCSSLEDWNEAVRNSRVVYVGNLNYFTTEEELYEVSAETSSNLEILSGAQCDGRVIRVDPDSGRDIDGDRKFGRGASFRAWLDEVYVVLRQRVPCVCVLNVARKGTSGRQWRDEWRDFYDPGRGGEGGEPGKRARQEFEASLMASHLMPLNHNHAGGFHRNVRQRWASGGGGPPGVPPPPFPGPLPPADWGPPPPRGAPHNDNPFAYNKKFARGRRP